MGPGPATAARLAGALLPLLLAGCSSLGGGGDQAPAAFGAGGPGDPEALAERALAGGPPPGRRALDDLFLRASDASLGGRGEEAARLFALLVRLEPGDAHLRRKLAWELVRTGDLKGARRLLEGLFGDPAAKGRRRAGLALARVALGLGDAPAAEAVYRRMLREGGEGAGEACAALGRLLLARSEAGRADRLLAGCGRRFRDRPVFPHLRGTAALRRGRPGAALRHFGRALARRPDHRPSVVAAGLVHEGAGRADRALALYGDFLGRRPDDPAVLARSLRLLLALGRDREALPRAEALSGLDPGNLNLKVRLGALYTGEGRLKEAAGVFGEVLSEAPDSDKVRFFLGALHREMGERDKALAWFTSTPPGDTLFPKSRVEAARILGARALDAEGGARGAAARRFAGFVGDAMGEAPGERASLGALLADFHDRTGDLRGAIDALRSVEGEEGFDDGHRYHLASLLLKSSDFGAAEEIVEGLIAKDPDDARALNFLGYSLVERGVDLDRARGYIERALRLRPDDGHILDSMGWYHYKAGNYGKALEHLKKAWSLARDDATINRHLALVHEKLRNRGQARRFYVRGLKHCRDPSERKEFLRAIRDLDRAAAAEPRRVPASAPGPAPAAAP